MPINILTPIVTYALDIDGYNPVLDQIFDVLFEHSLVLEPAAYGVLRLFATVRHPSAGKLTSCQV